MYGQPWPEGEYRLFQLGFLVEDLLGAATRWVEAFGIGPFHLLPRVDAPCTYRGAESSVDLQVGVAQAGPVQIELIQQFSDGPSVFRERFGVGESGLHQLCTVTEDFEGQKAHYTGRGYEIACEITAPGHRVAYVDTFADFGFLTEVVESSPSFLAHLSKISRTCATWDGTDPIRILTRDGYRTP
jgi:Glyoxalase/Bleomycin resistance protein/Dioxygenase superfamily